MNIDSIPELANLSEEEKKIALKVLSDMKDGDEELYNKLKYADYKEMPVDISTFIHDKQYLGNALYDAEGRFTLFPYWEEKLKEIFPNNIDTAFNTIILTGGIGLGKSTVAVICLLYMLHRLLCLNDPYLHYGMQVVDKISISLMNITIENAKGVALDKMNQMILSSSWFMSHGKMAGETNLKYEPDKHIETIVASSNNQVIGRCLDGDTVINTSCGDKRISDIVGKDIKVLSIDNDGRKVYSDICTVLPTSQSAEEYQIELEDGTVIKCTPEHRLMLKDGTYKEAQYLTEDDELFDCKNITYKEFSNPMYKNGYKVSGGNNGHATKRYTYNGLTFECRKELVEYLKTFDDKICISTLRKFENNSKRVVREHSILNNVEWRYKNEN